MGLTSFIPMDKPVLWEGKLWSHMLRVVNQGPLRHKYLPIFFSISIKSSNSTGLKLTHSSFLMVMEAALSWTL